MGAMPKSVVNARYRPGGAVDRPEALRPHLEVPVKTITPTDIIAALSHCQPAQLAHALASSPESSFQRLANAVLEAAQLKASFPRDDVIAEADALLYDVLRWPVADANPTGVKVDPISFAYYQQVSITEATRVLGLVAATESQACDQLMASGIEPNFTLAQSQVYDCVVTLRAQQLIPTRHLVREHATCLAASAMRPGEGSDPIIYSKDLGLSPRVVSPSPKVHVLLWLDRMDANPPQTGLLEDRIEFLLSAKAELGQASRVASELTLGAVSTTRASTAAITPVPSLSLAG